MSHAVPLPRIAAVAPPSSTSIVMMVVAKAIAEAAKLDVGEIFSIKVDGVNEVSEPMMTAIAERAARSTVRLNYVIGTRCHFIVHEKGR